MAQPLRFLTYLAPSIPLEFFELVVRHVEARAGMPASLSSETEVSGPSLATDPFASGRADLAFVCAFSYPILRRAGTAELVGAAPVSTDVRNGGRPVYFSDVIVRSKNPAASLRDLRGARWTYNDPASLSGWHTLRAQLEEIGHRGGPEAFFREVRVSGSHRASTALVASGQADASAIDSNALRLQLAGEPAVRARIRILESWGPLPVQPLLARKSLPRSVRESVEDALLSMHDDASIGPRLSRFGMARFGPVAPAFYDAFPIGAIEERAPAAGK